jgi:hypothetical protein
MAQAINMLRVSELTTQQLEAQIQRFAKAVKIGKGSAQARKTLMAFLLEKERRHISAFTDEQLKSAIDRYNRKVAAGDRGAAKVLDRLQREHARRQQAAEMSRGTLRPPAGSPVAPVPVAAVPATRPGSVRTLGGSCTKGPAYATVPRYTGVGGWLLFFCVCLTIVSPIVTVGLFSAGFSQASPHFHRFPGLRTLCVMDGLLSAGVVIVGFYAGIALWTMKQNAVQIAKAYLVVYLIGSAVSNLILPLMAGLPSQVTAALLGQGVVGMFGSLAGFSLWNWYLSNSKRVKATFGHR